MTNKNRIIHATMMAFLALAATPVVAKTMEAPDNKEKCFGVVKAGQNDCSTTTTSCAGSATKDGQGDAFILLEKGVCQKLVNGHLKPQVKRPTMMR